MKKPSKIETVIRDWIFSRIRTSDPSEPIPTIRKISRILEVSPTSVQKVVNQLKQEGLIDSFVGKGIFIKPIAFKDQRKILFISVYDLDENLDGTAYPAVQAMAFRRKVMAAGCNFEHLNISGMSNSDIPGKIRQGGFSGVALFEISDDHLLMEIQKLMIPLVSLDYDACHLGLPSVVFDNGWGAFMVTKHLVSQGHARISALTCEPQERSGHNRFRDPVDEIRIAGYRYAMMDAGLVPEIVSLSFKRETLKNTFFSLMARKNRPTALFIYHYFLAEIVAGILREGAYRIPEDISIVTVSGENLEFEPGRRYTSVAFSSVEMGDVAAGFLLKILGGEPLASSRHVIEARLLTADSVHQLA
jgi:DNA-binding LacI/PurR family transcriptional regulator